ncbi:MAG: hypothetical protein ACYC5K_11655 [Saccharofermentanales bacterium]
MHNSHNSEFYWYRLDNIAKVYPIVSSEKTNHVYRIAVNLAMEIDPVILQQAVVDCKPRFPSFYVKMRRGLFWYYYETNDKLPVIKPESSYICSSIEPHKNNGYFFTFFYFRNRISVEIFHSITDGKGAFELLKTVVMRYLQLLGFAVDTDGMVMTLDQKPSPEETEDSYLKNYNSAPIKKEKIRSAYHMTGTRFPQGGLGVLNGRVRTDELSRLAKSYNATISQFLTALLTHAIIQTGDIHKISRNPVAIVIPIDMRRFYNSRTLRNFFLLFRTSTICRKSKPEFEEILEQIKQKFISELTPEKLQNTLNINVSHEKHVAANYFPLAIKWLIIKGVHVVSSRIATTSTMSNLGIIELPDSMKGFVKDFEINFALGDNFTHNLAVVTFNGRTTIGFTRCVIETELERTFFSFLSAHGLQVEVQSNSWEDYIS